MKIHQEDEYVHKNKELANIRFHLIIYLHIILFTILNPGCRQINLERRIEIIENGLIKAVTIEGHPIEKNRILDRLEYHNVPGVSIAVINNFKIEWARGYGDE